MTFDHIINSHEKIALELSGGKDSLAVLHLLKDYLKKITVYWCNAGDPDPSVLKSLDWAQTIAPNFVEIRTDVQAFRRRFGAAASVVPISDKVFPIISDQICCMHNIMIPMDAKVRGDGNTLIIRGQKASDADKGQLSSGDWVDGVEFLYPIENWTDADVMTYLISNDVPIPKVYRYSSHGIDCLHCSGWWKHDHMEYLKDNHPRVHTEVTLARRAIKNAVAEDMRLC